MLSTQIARATLGDLRSDWSRRFKRRAQSFPATCLAICISVGNGILKFLAWYVTIYYEKKKNFLYCFLVIICSFLFLKLEQGGFQKQHYFLHWCYLAGLFLLFRGCFQLSVTFGNDIVAFRKLVYNSRPLEFKRSIKSSLVIYIAKSTLL